MEMEERICLREPPSAYRELGTPGEILCHLAEAEACRTAWRVASDGFPALRGLSARETVAAARRYPRAMAEELIFGAGGTYCHRQFFGSLRPNPAGSGPVGPGPLGTACLARAFGSADGFAHQFREAAKARRTGGFLWLLLEGRHGRWRMVLTDTEGYDLPPWPGEPLLCLDLWEHAYRSRFGSNRAAYAGAYLRLADWDRLERQLAARGIGAS